MWSDAAHTLRKHGKAIKTTRRMSKALHRQRNEIHCAGKLLGIIILIRLIVSDLLSSAQCVLGPFPRALWIISGLHASFKLPFSIISGFWRLLLASKFRLELWAHAVDIKLCRPPSLLFRFRRWQWLCTTSDQNATHTAPYDSVPLFSPRRGGHNKEAE